jgi:hypothetical protein
MTDPTEKANSILYVTSSSTGSSTPANYISYLTQLNEVATVADAPIRIASNKITIDTPIAPWFGAVQRRLMASIGTYGSKELESGAALTKEVVTAANSFFAAASNLLPGEPYLYGLPHGRLVAEFTTRAGGMTVVISEKGALAMTSVGGETVHLQISLGPEMTPQQVQKDLSKVTSHLRTDTHGSLDSRSQ